MAEGSPGRERGVNPAEPAVKAGQPAEAGPAAAGPAAVADVARRLAGAAAGGDPGAGRLLGADLGTRWRLLSATQAAAGNGAVQRLLAASPGPTRLARHGRLAPDPDGGREPTSLLAGSPALQRQPSWGGGTKHTFKLSKDVKIDKGFGPVKLSKATFGGEATVDLAEGAGAQAGAPTQVRAGAVGGPGASGYQAEVERAVGDKLTIWGQEFQPKVKLGAEKTNKSAEIGVEGGLEGQWASTSVKFVIVGKDYSEGSIEIATLKWKVVELKKEFPFELLGKSRKLELKGSVELSFEPDWARIGAWLLEQLATDAAIEAAVVGGIIVAGAATIAYAVYAIATAGEIAERVDAAAANLRGATAAYRAVMTGGERPGGPGADIGAREADSALARATVPLPSIFEENKKKDLSVEAWNALAPKVRAAAIEDYWKVHWFEKWVAGPEGMGSGGFRTFKRVLDAAIPPSI